MVEQETSSDEDAVARLSLRVANALEVTWLYVRGNSVAGSRCRSQHGDLQHRQRHAGAYGQEQADREAVRGAVLDYVEAIYNVDPSRIERSVHPKLAKIGFYRGPSDANYRAART
jgi:hypothetical protein